MRLLISILYEFALILGFLVYLPKALYQMARYGKYRESAFARFGCNVTKIEGSPLIWVHAVSVGECRAIMPLIARMTHEIPHAKIVVSNVTETGHNEAKRLFPHIAGHIYLPFDFRFSVRRVLKQCTPDLVILCEGDFWFNFLKQAKRLGAVVCVVNGKLSERSQKRLAWVSTFTKQLFSLVDFFCVQSELYKERFLKLGLPASKIRVTGNLKCDARFEPLTESEKANLRQKLYLEPNDTVVVAASTHAPEEEQILQQLHNNKNFKLVIVPRHIERVGEIEALLQKYSINYATWNKEPVAPNPQVIVVDAMGVLMQVYQIAQVAIVAGSFISRVGGHNILEPQAFGIPVIVGPHMHTQAHLLESALYFDAIEQVEIEKLADTVAFLLKNPERRSVLSANSLKMVLSLTGAIDKTMREIHFLVPQYFTKM